MGIGPANHCIGQYRPSLGRTCGWIPTRWHSLRGSSFSFPRYSLVFTCWSKNGIIEQGATLLHLQDSKQFNENILIRAAKHSEENDRIPEAIKLYNLAGDYSTVVVCLAQALGNTIAQPNRDSQNVKMIEQTAADILRHYERTNKAVGKDRDAVVRLLRIRSATDAKNAGRMDVALDVSKFLIALHSGSPNVVR